MAATLAAPVIALFVLSFWTQRGFDIDPTFTLANYWKLIEPSADPMVWMGIPFPFAYPVAASLMLKSLVMSLVATIVVIAMAIGFSAAGILVMVSPIPRPMFILGMFGFITAVVACVLGRKSAGWF